jgi:SET domain-containing protein
MCICRSQLLYYMVLVAKKDIEPYEEITYDYNYNCRQRADDNENRKAAGGGDVQMGEAGRVVVCGCGAPKCSGRLL